MGAGRSDQLVTADAAQPLSQLTSSQDVTFTHPWRTFGSHVESGKCIGVLATTSKMAHRTINANLRIRS